MLTRKRFRTSSALSLPALLLVGTYVGCFPDLDALSAGDDETETGGASGEGGTSTGGQGGTSSGGNSGTSGGGGEETGGTGNTDTGGTSGSAGDGGNAGETGGNGGMGADGGACSTDTDIGMEDGNTVVDCGECGLTCSLRNASRSICTDGICEPICRTGYDNCNPGDANDGCETAVTTPANCGACGAACSVTNVMTGNCVSGMCAPTCSAGFLDCNAATANDGCEVGESQTDCGACGYVCSLQHAAGAACAAGRCAPTCAPGYGNCNSTAQLPSDDGCETFLDSLTACQTACGSTIVDCDALSVCNQGSCVPPQGMAVLTVPLSATGQNQRYGNIFPGFPDLTNGIVTMRMYAPGATGGNLTVYFTDDPDFTAAGGRTLALSELSSGWTDQTFAVGGPAPPYDPSRIRQINIVVSSENTAGPWTNPTVIYIDSVRSSNNVINDYFNVGTPLQGPTSVQNMAPSTQQTLEGSTLTWADTVP